MEISSEFVSGLQSAFQRTDRVLGKIENEGLPEKLSAQDLINYSKGLSAVFEMSIAAQPGSHEYAGLLANANVASEKMFKEPSENKTYELTRLKALLIKARLGQEIGPLLNKYNEGIALITGVDTRSTEEGRKIVMDEYEQAKTKLFGPLKGKIIFKV